MNTRTWFVVIRWRKQKMVGVLVKQLPECRLRAFFNHIDPAMKTMAGLLRQRRWTDEIMQLPNT
jgi:hypothetical protein